MSACDGAGADGVQVCEEVAAIEVACSQCVASGVLADEKSSVEFKRGRAAERVEAAFLVFMALIWANISVEDGEATVMLVAGDVTTLAGVHIKESPSSCTFTASATQDLTRSALLADSQWRSVVAVWLGPQKVVDSRTGSSALVV